ncbi:hypothetical protein T484DRAFT_1777397 [Baffinella frigidus]|nr:hypothetical protein T484DRAFT_1777397 [Cryptophyta sp. CCMP2293]
MVYKGDFRHGQMHGQGTLVTGVRNDSNGGHADGHAGGHAGRGGKCEYVGGFEDDRPHGKGQVVFEESQYLGEWLDGNPDGTGTLLEPQGKKKEYRNAGAFLFTRGIRDDVFAPVNL